MRSRTLLSLAGAVLLSLSSIPASAQEMASAGYEVWALDQSGTAGTMHIFDGAALTGDPMGAMISPTIEKIALSGDVESLCLSETGTAPVRGHMAMFNPAGTHAIVAFVATGHVVFMDVPTRAPVRCIDVGEQAHAAFPSPDGSYVVVANQAGKKLQRINTDADGDGVPYGGPDDLALDDAATLDLAACTTPNGAPCEDPALRPNNTVICPVVDSTSRLVFVTLGGGGLFVVDGMATPMSIVSEYDRSTIKPNGCGGIESNGKMYINSGAFPANPRMKALYALDLAGFPREGFNEPNTPAPGVIFESSDGDFDAHGMALVKRGLGTYIWAGDRFANAISVVDPATDAVVNVIELAGMASPDPAPDLMAVAPDGSHVFLALRGPCPLTANDPQVGNAVGATPGVGVVRTIAGGAAGELVGVTSISVPSDPFDCGSVAGEDATTERADVHWVGVVRK